MFKKILHVLAVLSILFGALAFANPAAALGTRRATARGTIVAIDPQTKSLTVSQTNGTKVKVNVSSSTSVKRKGKTSAFSSLRVGDKATVQYNPSTNTASNVSDTPGQYEIHGTIEAVDSAANTVTVASEDGGVSVTLNVDANTDIQRNGASAALADLVVGDKVEAKYDSSTMLASKIQAEAEDGELHGTIASIDTAANTITITPKDGSADVTLTVIESTVIKRDDVVVTLADLAAGDAVEAKYDTATLTASKIEVEDAQENENEAEIKGTVAAVDTTAGTVTITPLAGGADVVLNVTASTVIESNAVAITLADLQIGSIVEASYDSASMNAIRIKTDN